uniref:Uncharacterized protein n=1 Tax=Vespula pensylvanica TaxID=30213 RepID=A0A834JZB6_VESPE|nr:hypothetical protein H0235_016991 [Vespula pensylvanica]
MRGIGVRGVMEDGADSSLARTRKKPSSTLRLRVPVVPAVLPENTLINPETGEPAVFCGIPTVSRDVISISEMVRDYGLQFSHDTSNEIDFSFGTDIGYLVEEDFKFPGEKRRGFQTRQYTEHDNTIGHYKSDDFLSSYVNSIRLGTRTANACVRKMNFLERSDAIEKRKAEFLFQFPGEKLMRRSKGRNNGEGIVDVLRVMRELEGDRVQRHVRKAIIITSLIISYP